MKNKVILITCLALIVGLSIWLRIILPYNNVFTTTEIKFATVDCYAHMRLADWCYQYFPNMMKYDAYLSYPDGAVIGARPLLSFIIAALAKGLGTSVDIIGAWLPAILGILLLVPVFIISWKLFGEWAAAISCLFIAVMPGELVGRTLLGAIDHDALEIFLQVLTLMFLILAIKKNWLFSIGAGICLGIYNLNWIGAPLLTVIFMFYLVIQSIVNQFRNESSNKLCYIMLITFILGFVIYVVPIEFRQSLLTYNLLYIGAILVPAIILLLTKYFNKYSYIISLAITTILGIVIIATISQITRHNFVLLQTLSEQTIGAFIPQSSGLGTTISEMLPLLYYRGVFTLDAAWNYFGLCLPIGLVSLGYLTYKTWKQPANLLFIIWCTFTITLTILQRRYGYWAAVSLGILSGYILWYICSNLSIRQLNRKQRKRKESSIRYEIAIISGLVALLLVFMPLLSGAYRTAQGSPYIITDAWSEGLHWLDNNTPKILDGDGQIPEGTINNVTPPTDAAYNKIDGYGIVSWWDYGYWIVLEGKRPAIVHPGGGWLLDTSHFLLCKENDSYLQEYIKRYRAKYIIIDYAMVTGKFYAIPEIAVSNMNSDIAKKIKLYTNPDFDKTLIIQLYYTGRFDKYELVWQSKQVYNKDAEVKIFEYIEEIKQ